jgi:hypothetical protein
MGLILVQSTDERHAEKKFSRLTVNPLTDKGLAAFPFISTGASILVAQVSRHVTLGQQQQQWERESQSCCVKQKKIPL